MYQSVPLDPHKGQEGGVAPVPVTGFITSYMPLQSISAYKAHVPTLWDRNLVNEGMRTASARIASIRGSDADSHWAIENAPHWVRDMTYDEDRCRIRTGSGPAAMARVRNFAISALRLGGHDNIARATRYYSRHLDKVTELLAPKAA